MVRTKMKYIENIIICVPLCSWTELITDGTKNDIKKEMEQTHFTSVRNLAYILKEIGVVKSVSEVRRNKPDLCTVIPDDTVDCFWMKWGKRRFYVVVGKHKYISDLRD